MSPLDAFRRLRPSIAVLALATALSAQERPWLEMPYAERPSVETKEKAQEALRLVGSARRAVEARPAESATKTALLEVLGKEEQLLKDILQLHDVIAADVTDQKADLRRALEGANNTELASVPAPIPARDPSVPAVAVSQRALDDALAAREKQNDERDKARTERDVLKSALEALELRGQAIPAGIEEARRVLDQEEETLARERAASTDPAQVELQTERAQLARFEHAKLTVEKSAISARKSNGIAQLRVELHERKLAIEESRAKAAAQTYANLEQQDREYRLEQENLRRQNDRKTYEGKLREETTPPEHRPWCEARLLLLDLEQSIAMIRDRRAWWAQRFETAGDIASLDEDARELAERVEAEQAGYDDLPNDPVELGELAAEIRASLTRIQELQEQVSEFRKRLSGRVQDAKDQREETARRLAEWSKTASEEPPSGAEFPEKSWQELSTKLEARAKENEDLLVEARRQLPARIESLRGMVERAASNLAWVDSRMLWSRSSSEISMESVKRVWRDARGMIPALENGFLALLEEIVTRPGRSIPRRIFGIAMLLAMTAFGFLVYRKFPHRLERLHEGATKKGLFLLRVLATLLRRTLASFLLAAGALAAAQVLDLPWDLAGPILIVVFSLYVWRIVRVLIDLLFDPTSPERVLPGDPALLGVIHRTLRVVLLISVVFVPIGLLLQQVGYADANPGFVELWWLVHRVLVAFVLFVSLFRPTALKSLFAGSKGTLALSFEQLFLLGYPLVAGAVLFLIVLSSLRYSVASEVFRDWLLRTLAAAAVAFLSYRWLLRTLRPDGEPDQRIVPDQFESEKEYLAAGRKLFFDRSVRLALRVAFIGAVALFSMQSWPLFQASIFSERVLGSGVRNASFAIIALFAALILLRTYRDAMRFVILPGTTLDRGVQYAILTLSSYVLFAIGLVVVFNLLNVSGEQIAWVVSALAVGIGFGLQSIVRNLVSGIIILIERPVKVGDRVIVGDRSGVVDRITIRSTTVMTYSNVGIVIPNEELVAGQVINQSLGAPKLRSDMRFSAAYGSDISLVRKTALEVCEKHGLVMKRPAPEVFVIEFGNSSIDFELRYWTAEDAHAMRIMSDLRMALDAAFRRNKIEMPYSQQDLHIRSVDPEVFELARAVPAAPTGAAAESVAVTGDARDGNPAAASEVPKEKSEKMPLPDRKLP